MPSFYQHVTFPTWGDKTLECVNSNIHGVNRALPRPHLGLSDHICILLAPAYRQSLCGPVMQPLYSRTVFSAQTDQQVFRETATSEGEVDWKK